MANRSPALALAAFAILAMPLTAYAAAEPAAKDDAYYTRKICKVTKAPTGSRLGAVRRCRSRAEEERESAETRAVAERITSGKNYGEALHNRASIGGYTSGSGSGGGCRATIRRC